MDQVALLLAHKSIKTTERHYAPFVKARQELTSSVRQAWLNQSAATKSVPKKKAKRASA